MKRMLRWMSPLLLLLLLCGRTALAQDVSLNLGDVAPTFEAVDADGKTWKSSDYVGKKVIVLYFYPAAMTGGCTKQACAFRDDRTKLNELGAEVVGVSGDNLEGLQVFRKAHRLNFPLLSDADGHVAHKFGVPVGKGGAFKTMVDGKEVTLERPVTTSRWTFIIGRDGKILYKDTDVDAANDSKAVIAALQEVAGN